jgi:hypothetical protein
LPFHLGHEADHSPPSSAEVEEWVELYLHSPIRLHGVVVRGSTRTTLPLPSLTCSQEATTLPNPEPEEYDFRPYKLVLQHLL